MLRTVAGRPARRRVQVSYFLAASLRCQASSVAGVTGEDLRPAPPRDEPGKHGEPDPVGRFVPHPPGVAAQHRVLVPEYQQLGVLPPVLPDHQHSQAENPAHQQTADLEQHPVSQPSPHQPRSQNGQVNNTIEFPGGTGRRDQSARGRWEPCGVKIPSGLQPSAPRLGETIRRRWRRCPPGSSRGQRGQDRRVGPGQRRCPGLSLEHGDLVARHPWRGRSGRPRQASRKRGASPGNPVVVSRVLTAPLPVVLAQPDT